LDQSEIVRRRFCQRRYLSHAESLTEFSFVEDLSMNTQNKNLTDLTPAPHTSPVIRSTPLREKVQTEHRGVDTVDFYAVARPLDSRL
jgi:hypothetical protein